MNKTMRVVVTGAAGQIGYALVFRIASGQLFGPNVDVELHLLERPEVLDALHGVAMELEDCAFPRLKRVLCTANLNEAMDGANWVLLVGSVPRKQGMERADLLKVNGGIFIEQGRAINQYAADDVRVFVVGNPCNTNCLIASHHAPDVPKDRFYAMTMLDELRARAQLAKKADVAITTISEMTIWGNHSATQYPDFYHAKINGVSAAEVIGDEHWLQETFVQTIQQRGAAVIKARGASSAASAANAILQGVAHILLDTVTGESYSMALHSDGQYGVDPGLIFSYPCRTVHGRLQVINDVLLNEYSQTQLQKTLQELRSERDAVRALGLLE